MRAAPGVVHSLGGARCSSRGPAGAASGAAAAEVLVRAAVPSRAGDGPEPGYANADNRAPGWPAGSRGWKEGAGAGLRTPPARPRGARGGCASRQRSRRSAFRCRPSARPVRSPVFSLLPSPALPPSLQPALRAPRSGPRRRRPQPLIINFIFRGVSLRAIVQETLGDSQSERNPRSVCEAGAASGPGWLIVAHSPQCSLQTEAVCSKRSTRSI